MSKLDEAIEKLKDIDDWDETSVNVTVHNESPKSKSIMPIKMLKILPPWGRVIVILAFLGIALASGVGAQLVLHALGISK